MSAKWIERLSGYLDKKRKGTSNRLPPTTRIEKIDNWNPRILYHVTMGCCCFKDNRRVGTPKNVEETIAVTIATSKAKSQLEKNSKNSNNSSSSNSSNGSNE